MKILVPILLAMYIVTPAVAEKPYGKGKAAEKEFKHAEKKHEKELKHAEKMHEKELKRAEKEREHAEKMQEKELKRAEKEREHAEKMHDKMKSEEDMKELDNISEKGLEQRRKWWQFW